MSLAQGVGTRVQPKPTRDGPFGASRKFGSLSEAVGE